jgi:hypothetical protein
MACGLQIFSKFFEACTRAHGRVNKTAYVVLQEMREAVCSTFAEETQYGTKNHRQRSHR